MTQNDILTSNGKYPDRVNDAECTTAVRSAAALLADRVGILLEHLGVHPKVSSGFRTKAANAAAHGAAHSAHLYGMAVDLEDPKQEISSAIMRDPSLLSIYDLYMEYPGHTPTWCHLQTRPIASGARIFSP